MEKRIPLKTIDKFIVSELIISDNYRMIVDYNPPYPTKEEE